MTHSELLQLVDRIAGAYLEGKAAALETTVGDEFHGAAPEAAKRYPVGSPEYNVFIDGFLYVLKSHKIYVSPETGRVTGFIQITKGNK